MKTTNKILASFITDFKLEIEDAEAVCFEATVEFRTKGVYRRLDTEVHIITLKYTGISVLYLLHPDVVKLHIPETLPVDATSVVYLKNDSLIIVGDTIEYGKFSITLIPLANACSEETLQELRSKKFN